MEPEESIAKPKSKASAHAELVGAVGVNGVVDSVETTQWHFKPSICH